RLPPHPARAHAAGGARSALRMGRAARAPARRARGRNGPRPCAPGGARQMSRVPSRRRARLFPTAEECEAAFYDAFERGDIKAMMAVWAESDDISCIHPSGARITGFDAVRESWVQIFAG